MAKHDRSGRSKTSGKHVRLYRWLLDSVAYRSLNPVERSLLVELYNFYNGENNGKIFLSVRVAAECLNVLHPHREPFTLIWVFSNDSFNLGSIFGERVSKTCEAPSVTPARIAGLGPSA